jgi:predicted MPP superfamily phosphohydrolase
MKFIPFLAVALSVYGGIHYFIYRSLATLGWSRVPLAAILWVLALSFPLAHFSGLVGKGKLFYWLNQISSLWMGAAFLLLMTLGAANLLPPLFRLIPGFPGLGKNFWLQGALVLAGVMMLIGWISVRRDPRLTEYTVDRTARYGQNKILKIVQLSDLHIVSGLTDRVLGRAIPRINQLNPDLIFITGDLIDPGPLDVETLVNDLKALKASQGVYAVTGNHEYYAGVQKFLSLMESAGIPVLQNRMAVTTDGFQIAGVNDPGRPGMRYPGQGSDVGLALRELGPDQPSILLSHQPVHLNAAIDKNVDLILSGHTHGGQIFPFHIFVRLVYKYCSGLYHPGPQTDLIVSNGVGWWGPPIRLLAPAQIVVVDFKY